MKKTIIRRNFVHILSAAIIPIAIMFGDLFAIGVSSLLAGFYALYLLFKHHPKLKTWKSVDKIIDKFSYYRYSGKVDLGPLFLWLGVIITLLFFSNGVKFPNPAYAGIMILAFGDGFAALSVLIENRRVLRHGKSLEGSIMCFVAGWLGASLFVPMKIAFVGALVGTFLESYARTIDDNILIPVFSAFVMSVLLW